MSENLPNIDDLFRKALDDHEDTPSRNVWASIDKNLDKKKAFSISKKYRKLKWVAAALLIFSAGMAMYTVHVRLRNKELVKQNEINKKGILKAGKEQMERGSMASKPMASALNETSAERAKGNPAATAPDSLAKTEIVSAPIKKVGSSPAKDKPVAVKKALEEKPEMDLSANTKRRVRANPALSIVTPSTVTTEKEDKPVVALENKNAVAEDELYFEESKKQVDIATVNDKVRVVPAFPVMPESSSISEMNAANTTQSNVAANTESVIKPFKGSRFSATAFYSKDFVSTSVNNDLHAFREDDRNEIKNKENITSSSSKGVLINYNIGKGWNIQSGLTFSNINTDIKPKTIFARPDNRGNVHYRINCSAGYSFVMLKTGTTPSAGDSILALSSKNTLNYVGVPFALSYSVPVGRLTLQPGAGLGLNFLSKSNIETTVATQAGNEKYHPDRIEGLNSSYINGSLSLAANYYFTKNVAVNFTPVARFGLSAINKDAPVRTYINSFGLAAGLTIAF